MKLALSVFTLPDGTPFLSVFTLPDGTPFELFTIDYPFSFLPPIGSTLVIDMRKTCSVIEHVYDINSQIWGIKAVTT